MKSDKKILLLAGRGLSTNIIFHHIHDLFGIHTVILEESESKKKFLQRRIKKLGAFEVAGQLLFQALMVPVLKRTASNHIQNLLNNASLKTGDIDVDPLYQVASVNDPSVLKLVEDMDPDLIIVNGTRIISKKLLSIVKCPVINMHAGITPLYRGVHGAYWALTADDKAHCGVTVHLVDPGVDTGGVLYQQNIEVETKDNFTTYPIKQLLAGLPLLDQAVKDALNGTLQTISVAGTSAQWYHPTIWKYLQMRWTKGVK
jgi:methionyl-tRNA formyltransferase